MAEMTSEDIHSFIGHKVYLLESSKYSNIPSNPRGVVGVILRGGKTSQGVVFYVHWKNGTSNGGYMIGRDLRDCGPMVKPDEVNALVREWRE